MFSTAINCAQSDKPKLIALEEARKTYVALANSAKSDPEKKLEAANQYLSLLASYESFSSSVKNQEDEEFTKIVYNNIPVFEHRSVINGKPASFSEAKMETYMILFQMVATQVDMQFQITMSNATPDVLRQQNLYLKQALGILDHLKTLSRDIAIIDKDVHQVAMELRSEIIGNLQAVVRGFFFINALDQGIKMNQAAAKNDEAPCYDYMVLAGFAKAAENAFKQAQSELDTSFKQDIKYMNPNYVQFIRSMYIVAQMYKVAMYYRHFYDISVNVDTSDKETEQANTQKYLLGNQMKQFFLQIEKLKIKSSGISNWFGERFDEHARAFKQISERGKACPGVTADLASPVQVAGTAYTAPTALWTELNIPGAAKLKKAVPAVDGSAAAHTAKKKAEAAAAQSSAANNSDTAAKATETPAKNEETTPVEAPSIPAVQTDKDDGSGMPAMPSMPNLDD